MFDPSWSSSTLGAINHVLYVKKASLQPWLRSAYKGCCGGPAMALQKKSGTSAFASVKMKTVVTQSRLNKGNLHMWAASKPILTDKLSPFRL